MRCLAGCGGDHFRMERSVLIGNKSVEADARLVAVPRVYVGDRLARTASKEVLAIGTRLRAVTPDSGQRQCAVRVDQASKGLRIGRPADCQS